MLLQRFHFSYPVLARASSFIVPHFCFVLQVDLIVFVTYLEKERNCYEKYMPLYFPVQAYDPSNPGRTIEVPESRSVRLLFSLCLPSCEFALQIDAYYFCCLALPSRSLSLSFLFRSCSLLSPSQYGGWGRSAWQPSHLQARGEYGPSSAGAGVPPPPLYTPPLVHTNNNNNDAGGGEITYPPRRAAPGPAHAHAPATAASASSSSSASSAPAVPPTSAPATVAPAPSSPGPSRVSAAPAEPEPNAAAADFLSAFEGGSAPAKPAKTETTAAAPALVTPSASPAPQAAAVSVAPAPVKTANAPAAPVSKPVEPKPAPLEVKPQAAKEPAHASNAGSPPPAAASTAADTLPIVPILGAVGALVVAVGVGLVLFRKK